MSVRIAIIPYALLRGERAAKRIRKGRMLTVCGLHLWVRS